MKKILTALSAFVLCLVMPLALIGCTKTTASQSVELSMNPEVVFQLDANNNVTSVTYKNEDANQIFVNVNFIGVNIDQAIEMFVNYSLISGHINLNGAEVDFKSLSKDNEALTALNNKVQTAIQNAFNNIGVQVSVANQSVADIQTAWEELYEKAREIAPEKSIIELKEMTVAELIGVIDQKQKQYAGIAHSQMEALEEQINGFIASFNVEALNQVFAQAQEALKSAQTQVNNAQASLNELKKQYGSDNVLVQSAQEALNLAKEVLDDAKIALADAKADFNEAVKVFKRQIQSIIDQAKADYADIKEDLKAQYQQAVDAHKVAVEEHLNAHLANHPDHQAKIDHVKDLIEKHKGPAVA